MQNTNKPFKISSTGVSNFRTSGPLDTSVLPAAAHAHKCKPEMYMRAACLRPIYSIQAIDVKFSQDLTHQKSLKSVNF